MKVVFIGGINLGIDGCDNYFLLIVEEKDEAYDKPPAEALDCVQKDFLSNVYERCRGPGTRFCTSVLVSPKQYSEDQFIGIAQVRYDI